MIKVALYIPGWVNNEIFDINHPANCDNWLVPFFELKKRLALIGYELCTADIAADAEILISFGKHYKGRHEKRYFFVTENQYIQKIDLLKLRKIYKKIFTWNDDDTDGKKIIKYYYPQYYKEQKFRKYEERTLMLSMIANNKCVSSYTPNDMYLQRQRLIEYFENYPDEFELFGGGWHLPFMKNSLLHKLNSKFKFISRGKQLAVYRGFAESKSKVYERSKFSICFENVRGIKGYVTEKIFDSFYSGCVPVYSGAANVEEYIPSNCFINYEDFNSIESLHLFLKKMPEASFNRFQENIIKFLNSKKFMRYSYENFCDIIINNILDD